MYEIANKLAVITGGTRGIGLGSRAASAGSRRQGRRQRPLSNGGGEPRCMPNTARTGSRSISATSPCRRKQPASSSARQKRFGRLDILVHSAGGPAPGKIVDLSPETWMDAFAVHVHPVFHLFRAAHPYLAREGGAVVLVSSVAGLRGCPGTVAYQTVKGALIPLAKALAFDHAAEGIRVNVLAPGIIRTRFHQAMTEAAKAHNLANRIPLQARGHGRRRGKCGAGIDPQRLHHRRDRHRRRRHVDADYWLEA